MKILIIDNASMIRNNDDLVVYSATGLFGKELKDLGNSVEYFQIVKDSNRTVSSFSLVQNGLKASTARKHSNKVVQYLIAYCAGCFRVLKNDFVYFFYPNPFSFLALIAKIFGKKYGLYVRGQKGFYSKKTSLLYKYAEIIFTVSDVFTQSINEKYKNKAITVRPMIFYDNSDIVRNRRYDRTNNFRVLFLGRISEDKGLIELIKATILLNESSSIDFTIEIVGDGADISAIKQLVKQNGLSNQIIFTGILLDSKKIREKYCNADIYILPTYHEGFPRTLYEAMLFGTPIITTFVGGIPGLMQDGYNCLSIEPKSITSIRNVLSYLMKNYSNIATKITHNARITVEKKLEKNELSHAAQLNNHIKT